MAAGTHHWHGIATTSTQQIQTYHCYATQSIETRTNFTHARVCHIFFCRENTTDQGTHKAGSIPRINAPPPLAGRFKHTAHPCFSQQHLCTLIMRAPAPPLSAYGSGGQFTPPGFASQEPNRSETPRPWSLAVPPVSVLVFVNAGKDFRATQFHCCSGLMIRSPVVASGDALTVPHTTSRPKQAPDRITTRLVPSRCPIDPDSSGCFRRCARKP